MTTPWPCLLGVLALLLVDARPLQAAETAAPPLAEAPAAAAPVAARPAPEDAWSYNIWKSITYEVAASTDGLIFGALYGGSVLAGGTFAAVNFLLAGGLYYLHEMTWSALGPDPNETEGVWLSVTKALTYRVVSTTRVLTTSFLLTGNPWLAGGYAILNNVIDTAVYLGNDVAWTWFGPTVPYLGGSRAPAPGGAAPAVPAAPAAPAVTVGPAAPATAGG